MTKIAFPTDDGETISAHLGRARTFLVAEYEGDGAPSFESRAKPQHGAQAGHDHPAGVELGFQANVTGAAGHHDSPAGHYGMFSPVADCQVLIAGGMGQPAFDGARQQGLTVVMTGERRIADALSAYRAGKLVSDLRRVHAHSALPDRLG